MARLENQKESKNFKDRVSSLIPQLLAPPGTYRPTAQQANVGHDSLLNLQFLKLLEEWEKQRKFNKVILKEEE